VLMMSGSGAFVCGNGLLSRFEISVSGSTRTIKTNLVPNHEYNHDQDV